MAFSVVLLGIFRPSLARITLGVGTLQYEAVYRFIG